MSASISHAFDCGLLLTASLCRYTPWSLEEGGTYVLPGTATDGQGDNVVQPGIDAEEFVRTHKYGIVSLCAPAGSCFVSDGRLLHAGAPRLASGRRLGNNVYYCRAQVRSRTSTLDH